MVDKELSKQGIAKYYSTKVTRQLGRVAVKGLFRNKIVFEKKEVGAILFIQLYGIGDYLMSTPAIKEIAKQFPRATTTLLCKGATKQIAELNPTIDKVIVDKGKVETGFDLVVSMNDSLESTIIAWKSKPKYVIGFLKGSKLEANFEIGKWQGAKENYNIIDNYLLIAKALGNKKIKEKEYVIEVEKCAKVEKMLKKEGLKDFIIINPNTRDGAEAKGWGEKNYALLSDKIIENGQKIVFCGAKGEEGSKKTIQLIHNKRGVFDFTGRLNLKEVTYLFSKSNGYIGNDTGLMHIAIAVKIPTIGIFGPTDSKRIFLEGKKRFAFQVKNKKWPCYVKGTFDIKQKQKFMDSIKVEKVWKKSTNF